MSPVRECAEVDHLHALPRATAIKEVIWVTTSLPAFADPGRSRGILNQC
jgi:hypothetical protein